MEAEPPNQSAVVVVNDLIFGTKVRSTAGSGGVELTVVSGLQGLCEALDRTKPALLIVDLNTANDSTAVIEAGKRHACKPFVLAYVAHVDTGLAAQAEACGADEVMPRSRFSRELPELLARHCGGAVDGATHAEASP